MFFLEMVGTVFVLELRSSGVLPFTILHLDGRPIPFITFAHFGPRTLADGLHHACTVNVTGETLVLNKKFPSIKQRFSQH